MNNKKKYANAKAKWTTKRNIQLQIQNKQQKEIFRCKYKKKNKKKYAIANTN
jgi:hypothetical protein